jgi:uncharacterized membrane protein SpoIIM required for sporulation
MKEEQFVKKVNELEAKYPETSGGKAVKPEERFRNPDFPADYRLLTYLLAMARARHYSATTRRLLERLVGDGHRRLYSGDGGRMRIAAYLRYDFPRCVRANGKLVILSACLFFVPLVTLPIIIAHYPSVAYVLVPGEQLNEMEQMYLKSDEWTEKRDSVDDLQMWAFYVANNIGVGLRTFAWGALCGVGSIFFMLYNGLVIGTVTGHVINAGAADNFFTFVCSHGAPELIGIVLSGAAGMKIGFALLAPGRLPRKRAFTEAAKQAFQLLVGAIALIFLAAFIEAFWSPNPYVPVWAKFTLASILWLGHGLYFLRAGKAGEA